MEDYRKKYEEALKRAKFLKENTDSIGAKDVSECFEKIFPELKESEGERIKKALIQHVRDKVSVISGWRKEELITWLEKQTEQKPIDKIQLGKKYKCIASPRYTTFMTGEIYKPEDKFLCSLMNFCYDCFEPIEDDERKPSDKVEQKPVEWGGEDETRLTNIIIMLKEGASHHFIKGDITKAIDWLKFLRKRIKGE